MTHYLTYRRWVPEDNIGRVIETGDDKFIIISTEFDARTNTTRVGLQRYEPKENDER